MSIRTFGAQAIAVVDLFGAPRNVISVLNYQSIQKGRLPDVISDSEAKRLASRIVQILGRQAITETWQLTCLTADELCYISHFGQKSVQDVQTCLAKWNLSLRGGE